MVFLKSELRYRAHIQDRVHAICRRHNMIVYGSFLTGNFHLNISNNETLSDLDLIGEELRTDVDSECIRSEVWENTGLNINVSVRPNDNHIKSLPRVVSRQLSVVDTSLTMYRKDYISDAYFGYLISKYILRSAYADIYFNSNLATCMASMPSLMDDPVFVATSKNKLQGLPLSQEDIEEISRSKQIQSKEILDGITVLCKTASVPDIDAYWFDFLEYVARYKLLELADDLSGKINDVLKNPNKRFNSDSQTRRSLSLSLGLAAG